MSIAKSYRTTAIVSIALQPLPKLIREVTDPFHVRSDVEKREILDVDHVPSPTLSEAIQVIRDLWEQGLNDDMVFLVLMSRMKQLLDECIVEGEIGERRHAIGERCRFDSHWEGGAEMNPRVRVASNPWEQDNSSTTLSEGSDARSMTYSAYTVRSVTSFKEQTSQLVWHEKRDSGLPRQSDEGCPPSHEPFYLPNKCSTQGNITSTNKHQQSRQLTSRQEPPFKLL